MSTPRGPQRSEDRSEKWLDAAALDLAQKSAHNLTHAEWLEVCAQARAALSLRDELAALRVESQEGAEIVGELKAELAEWKDKLGAMTAAHRYATDELAEGEVLRNRMGDILTLTVNALKGEPDPRSLHDWATLPDVARTLVNELAECRAKLAAQIERCGLAELAVAQRDIPLASSQARERELREALRSIAEWQSDCGWGIEMFVECKNEMIGLKNALARPADDAALREMLTKAWDDGEAFSRRTMTAEFKDHRPGARAALIARLLGGGK